jgi:hypothetical protein
MPPGQFKAQRKLAKADNTIPGMRSLHRGIHHHENARSVKQYMSHTGRKRNDFRDLLVHHQKINEELKDVYARTANLVKDNLTMDERKEESWKAFERIGGKRPVEKKKYAAHLAAVSKEKKVDRTRAEQETETGGEFMNVAEGSAVDKLRRKRVDVFVKKQVGRAGMLKRMGDPTNGMTGIGHFDRNTSVLTLRNRADRQVKRAVEADRRIGAVKSRRKGSRSMWDTNSFDVNRGNGGILRDASADLRIGRAGGGGRGRGGGRGGGGGGGRGGRGGGGAGKKFGRGRG